MQACERLECRNHGVRIVAHRFVASDEVCVGIGEPHGVARQATRRQEIEEDGAAADEGLLVAREAGRIERAEDRQQLSLAAGPREQRPELGAGLQALGFRLGPLADHGARLAAHLRLTAHGARLAAPGVRRTAQGVNRV